MDVDYSFEARLRGYRLMQVPVSLQHEESRTTRKMWAERPELAQHFERNRELFYEKWRPFLPALPSEEIVSACR
jgi:GT2 family glycosyltransferase